VQGVVGLQLFERISIDRHACSPNAVFTSYRVEGRRSLAALSAIEKGSHITISYFAPLQPTPWRKQTLMSAYGFQCTCGVVLLFLYGDPPRYVPCPKCNPLDADGVDASNLRDCSLLGFTVFHAARSPWSWLCSMCGHNSMMMSTRRNASGPDEDVAAVECDNMAGIEQFERNVISNPILMSSAAHVHQMTARTLRALGPRHTASI